MSWKFLVCRTAVCPSERKDELDKDRMPCFYFNRMRDFNKTAGFALCGNRSSSIGAGGVRVGPIFRIFFCVAGLRNREFPMFRGMRGAGYWMSLFSRDHGIILSPVQPRKTPWAFGTATVIIVIVIEAILALSYRNTCCFDISHQNE